MGEQHLALGDRAQALAHFRRALAIREKQRGDLLGLANAKLRVGQALALRGSPEERTTAIGLAQAAAETFTAQKYEQGEKEAKAFLASLRGR